MISNGYVGAEHRRENRNFPVSLIVPATTSEKPPTLPMTVKEARALANELFAVADEAEDATRTYVQVVYGDYDKRYTYIDPTGSLLIGDTVSAGGRAYGLAIVVALGKDEHSTYTGPYRKLTHKLSQKVVTTEELIEL